MISGIMAKAYDHNQIENKWQKFWESTKTFSVNLSGDGEKPKFYCLDMFPYPSGAGLHIGHPMGYTGSDIYSRYMRHRGYQVLHPMGYDAFGLPAEQHAILTGEHPAKFTLKNCETFTNQLKKVGLSFDWSRAFNTCDPEYYRWTQDIFIKLFNSWYDDQLEKARPIEELPIPEDISAKGELAVQDYQSRFRLAYYAEALVNWCPALGTVLANEEVINGRSERGDHEVFRKPLRQWFLRITKYAERLLKDLDLLKWPEPIIEQQRNWIGRREGVEIEFQGIDKPISLRAFTTRPDTLFGVTFFVISPEHPSLSLLVEPDYTSVVQEYCAAASRLSDLDRTIENRKKTGVFTGSFLKNPINGEAVPLYVGDYVLANVGTGAVMGVPAHDYRDFEFARTFGIDIRPVLLPESAEVGIIKAISEGEIAWSESGVMLAVGEDPLRLSGLSNFEAGAKISDWLEKNGFGKRVIQYKLRDWLFSRQRYWGEPIPIIHWEDGTVTAVNEDELPLTLPDIGDFKPSESGESPLAKAATWLEVTCPKTGKKGRRETNTMPQWAGSCWYYIRFVDPHNQNAMVDPKLAEKVLPVDLYVGGAEHAVLHLLYARFWHKVLYDLGVVTTPEPFISLRNQGMVESFAYQDQRGALVPVDQVKDLGEERFVKKDTGEPVTQIVAKMSKSLRNVISLDSVVNEFGADTYRMYLMFMAPFNQSRSWNPRAVPGISRFLKRAWRFVTGEQETGVRRDLVDLANEPENVKRSIHKLIKRVTEDIENFSFNTAIAGFMEFINEVESELVSRETIKNFVLLLSPFAPHLAEEFWQRLGHNQSIAYVSWPTYEERYLEASEVNVAVQVNGKKRGVIVVSVDASEESLRQRALSVVGGDLASKNPQFFIVRHKDSNLPRLVNVVF
ncbi:MAG TPA: leucine--tRNA ligase [Oligoflexia bacterium]|nr:leucine--tRNA ligase [Oligoflexia bacterium]HMP26643.1 leucine--tRNA ligase [Oligoflexia bacterium]